MIQLSNNDTITSATYSTEHYENYNQSGDKNCFEEVIDKMILDQVVGMNESFKNAISNLSKDKKRMAILSLLDKDRNLFKNIKALVDKDINKMDHIKDVILMLRDYVKVGEVEKKKFGEVMTPLDLVKEMLNTLPDEVWSNPNLKWLDPANGTGPFPIMVIYKLMIGLKDWEKNEEKRYKHIVENMIYVAELQPKNMFLYLCAVDPFDTYKLNIYTGSFLDNGFDYHMKNVWGIEKFDIVIGNPPYNDSNDGDNNKTKNLYNIFSIKSLEISDKLIFITPSRWFGIENMSNMRKALLNNGLSSVNICDDSVFGRNVSIDGGVSYFYVDRNSQKEIEIKKGNDIVGGVINTKIVLSKNIEIVSNIISKIKLKTSKYMSSLYKRPQLIKSNDKRFKDNGIEVLASKNRRLFINFEYDDSKQYYTKYKLVFEKTSGSFRRSGISGLRVEKPNLLTTESIAFFPFDSELESINCLSYLKTNFAFLLRDINQSDKNFNQYVFDLLPMLNFNKQWSDDLIFEYFDLTEEESDFIRKYKS